MLFSALWAEQKITIWAKILFDQEGLSRITRNTRRDSFDLVALDEFIAIPIPALIALDIHLIGTAIGA